VLRKAYASTDRPAEGPGGDEGDEILASEIPVSGNASNKKDIFDMLAKGQQ
jgi:hypothetical protein